MRRHVLIARFLSAFVSLNILMMPVLPALASEFRPSCGIEEHTHAEDCYAVEPEHVIYICGFDGVFDADISEESSALVHEHDEGCVAVVEAVISDVPVCGLEEHVHGHDCQSVSSAGTSDTDGTSDDVDDDAGSAFRIDGVAAESDYTYEGNGFSVEIHIEGDASSLDGTYAGVDDIVLDLADAADDASPDGLPAVIGYDEDVGHVLDVRMVRPVFTAGSELDVSDCVMRVRLTFSGGGALLEGADEDAELVRAVVTLEEDLLTAQDVAVVDGSDSVTEFEMSGGGIMLLAEYGVVNPHYTLQHYFYFRHIPMKSSGTLPILNVSGGIPANGGTQTPSYINLTKVSDGSVGVGSWKPLGTYELYTEVQLRRLFQDEQTSYVENMDIRQMDRLYNNLESYNGNYTLTEIWVGRKGLEDDINSANFTVYPVRAVSSSILHDPESIAFTNNPSNPRITPTANGKPTSMNTDPNYPYDYTVLVTNDSIIRLVFTPTEEDNMSISDVNMFDYDVGDGYLYTSTSLGGKTNTSAQKANPKTTYYLNTNLKGINSNSNYSGSGAKFSFGNNKNIGTGRQGETWSGNSINMGNSSNFRGVTYGMVTGYANSGNALIPVFASGLSVQDLYGLSDATATGKTVYSKNGSSVNEQCGNVFDLLYHRRGSTYTLSSIALNGRVVDTNKQQFIGRDFSSATYSNVIYSNDFWPMDYAPSYGADGHDFAFGASSNYRRYVGASGTTSTMPPSDDGLDHNSYFGMSFSVEFRVDPGYIGPLEYLFFGDDDMWVILDRIDGRQDDAQVIVDIGGVHSAMGQYVDLWNYIDPVPYGGESQYYRIIVFYNERGASGSTCYIKYTLPIDLNILSSVEIVDMKIEKEVLGEPDELDSVEYGFQLTIYDGRAAQSYDIYNYSIYNSWQQEDGSAYVDRGTMSPVSVVEKDTGLVDVIYEFKLKAGQYIIIEGVPIDWQYRIVELDTGDFETTYWQGRHLHYNGATMDTIEMEYANTMTLLGVVEYNYIRVRNFYFVPRLPDTGGFGPHAYYVWVTAASVFLAACIVLRGRRRAD